MELKVGDIFRTDKGFLKEILGINKGLVWYSVSRNHEITYFQTVKVDLFWEDCGTLVEPKIKEEIALFNYNGFSPSQRIILRKSNYESIDNSVKTKYIRISEWQTVEFNPLEIK